MRGAAIAPARSAMISLSSAPSRNTRQAAHSHVSARSAAPARGRTRRPSCWRSRRRRRGPGPPRVFRILKRSSCFPQRIVFLRRFCMRAQRPVSVILCGRSTAHLGNFRPGQRRRRPATLGPRPDLPDRVRGGARCEHDMADMKKYIIYAISF